MTDPSTLLLALPVFFIAYSGVGMLLDSKRAPKSLQQPARPRVNRDVMLEIAKGAGRLAFNQLLLRIRGYKPYLDNLLLRSGYPFGWNAAELLGVKEMGMLLAAGACFLTDTRDPVAWGVSLLVGFLALDLLLRAKSASRRTDMQRQLPAYVDLLALTVESGLDLLVASERIVERMKAGPLKEEVQVMMQESRLGSSRKDVLMRWAYRIGLGDAQSLASLIIQADEMGTSLAGVLRSYAEDMRNRRILRAEELAGKIPVKILFPMIVFFFPIIFIIILGPVAVEFLKNSK